MALTEEPRDQGGTGMGDACPRRSPDSSPRGAGTATRTRRRRGPGAGSPPMGMSATPRPHWSGGSSRRTPRGSGRPPRPCAPRARRAGRRPEDDPALRAALAALAPHIGLAADAAPAVILHTLTTRLEAQRGVSRPQGAACDSGAVESTGFTLSNLTGTPQQTQAGFAPFPAPLGATVTGNVVAGMIQEPVNGGQVKFTVLAVATANGSAYAFFTGNAAGCTILNGGGWAVCTITGGKVTSPTLTSGQYLGTFTVSAGGAGIATAVSYSLTDIGPVTLSPASLPDGAVGSAYNQSVSATGGTGMGYSYAVAPMAGEQLPPGLMLSSATGAITGTPTTAGSYTFTITATDSGTHTGSKQYTVTVSAVSVGNVIEQLVTDPAVAASLKDLASQIATAPNAGAKQNKLNAYISLVNAQTGKSITPQNAAILITLAKAL